MHRWHYHRINTDVSTIFNHNILHNMLPMHDVTPERLSVEAERWRPRLQHLPQPFTAVLVGGSSGPYVFTAVAAARLQLRVEPWLEEAHQRCMRNLALAGSHRMHAERGRKAFAA